MSKTIWDLIVDARDMVNQLSAVGVITQPLQLAHAVAQDDFSNEVAKLEAMMALKDDETIKAEFIRLCHARDAQNEGKSLHIASNPDSFCNTLYFNIATCLYPDANFKEIFKLLVPHVGSEYAIHLEKAPRTSSGKKTKARVSLELSWADTNSLLTLLPIKIDTFHHLLIHQNSVLPLGEIEGFNFQLHRQLHTYLTDENKSSLRQAIATHNESFFELYSVLDRVNGQGLTLREVILPLER
jgi:hypothetical protein